MGELGDLEIPQPSGGGSAVKFVDEYRREEDAQAFVRAIRAKVTRPWTLMEICGGPDAHAAHARASTGCSRPRSRSCTGRAAPSASRRSSRSTARSRSPQRPSVIFTSFGDMLRVPGSTTDLLRSRRRAATCGWSTRRSTRVTLAQKNPDRQVVFFAVGFETTAPAQRHGRLAGEAARPDELLRPRLARPRPARDGGDPLVAGQPRAGLPRSPGTSAP